MNNKKYWLRGGLIFVIISILLMSTILFEIFDTPFGNFNLMKDTSNNLLFTLPFSQCGLITQCSGEGCMICIFAIPVIILVDFFIIGTFIGWVYGKIKNRKKDLIV
jgi:hypothetical protein